jgi:rRNA-processing protein EBP2
MTDPLQDPSELEETDDLNDEDATLADDLLDEIDADDEDGVEVIEGFGLVAEDETEDEEDEDEEDDEESLEDDAEDVDYDRFDDVDEL